MNLRKYIQPGCILTQVVALDKDDLLRQQAEALHRHTPERYGETLRLDDLLAHLRAREEKQSTGLGDGIAVPHARIPAFDHLGFCLAVLKDPLPFDSIDGKPIRVSCMVVAAAEAPNIVIKVWSTMARLLHDPAVLDYFLNARNADDIYQYLQRQELDLEFSITAGDIMVKPQFEVRPETPLPDVTYQMYRHKEPSTAVVDAQGRMLGEITSDAVFQYGMPEFFTQLQSVSFIRHFNPLDKYFQDESGMLARDILSKDYAAVSPGATLIEVLFLLSVKKHTKVYVIGDGGKLVGVIGRLSVLDRAINF
jgi:PTS system nitrogen regulatory IIA component